MKPLTGNKNFGQSTNAVLCVLKSQPDRVWKLDEVIEEVTHGDVDWALNALTQLTTHGWLEMRHGLKTLTEYYRLTEAGRRAGLWFPDRDFPTADTAV